MRSQQGIIWIRIKDLQSSNPPSVSPMPASKSSTIKRPVKTSKASSSKRPRASSASDADIPNKKHKRKPANDTSEDEGTSSSPVRPHQKQSKPKRKAKAKAKPKPKARRPAPVAEEVEEDDVVMVSEPEVVVVEESDRSSQVSVSIQLDIKQGTYFLKDLSDRHVAEVQERLTTKTETARDLDLIFTKRVQVVFTTSNGKSETRHGRWCILCK
jgi:hypothetical protein